MSLKKQTFSGLFWTFIDTFFLSGVSFVAMIYIAKLLGPAEFGLIGMITIFISIGTSLVDSGLSSSIIRTKEADERDYNTVFYLNIGASVIVYIIFYFVAPYIAQFFRQEVLIDIIRVYCISFIISALSAIQLARLNREMEFKKIMKFNIPGTLIGVVVGVVLSIKGFGVWSIVWMQIVKQLIKSIILWSNSPWKPRFYFSKEKMMYHYEFGYKLMLSGLLNTIFSNIYNVVIGRFYSVQSLGFYERSRALTNYPVSTFSGIINRVMFPIMANIKDDFIRVSSVYKNLLQLAFFVSAPMMLGAAAIASPVFDLVLGEKWMPAVPYFQILCLSSMFLPIHAFNLNILKVFGRSDLFLKLEIYKKVVIAISILVSFPFGILGLIWSTVFSSFIALLINTYYSQDLIDYKTRKQLLDMLPTFFIALFISLIMFYLVHSLSNYSKYIQIAIPSIIGILGYITLNLLFKRPSMKFAIQLIQSKRI